MVCNLAWKGMWQDVRRVHVNHLLRSTSVAKCGNLDNARDAANAARADEYHAKNV